VMGAAVLLAGRDPAGAATWLNRSLLPGILGAPGRPAMVGASMGLLVLLLLTVRRARPLEAGLFWAAAAGSLALRFPTASPARGPWLLGAALALTFALVESAYALAFRDELTDLPGRRALGGLLSSLRPPYAIAIVDVDHFKRFNDRHGHDVGDQVLRMVAARLAAVGGGGRAFRSGGEEFTVVFPGTSRDDALPHLEALRRAVAETPFVPRRGLRPRGAKGAARRGSGKSGRGFRVTISVGVAAGGPKATSPEQVVKSADQAMYRAKQKGRNRVVA
jgi:GGDEF domain-containing protein